MNTEIYLYLMGPARQFHADGKLTLPVKECMTVGMLRERLKSWLNEGGFSKDKQSILNTCVFADTQKILRENDPLHAGSEYVLIPPISGG